jgi:glycosyltransferase involved in cell wall biosynthesis
MVKDVGRKMSKIPKVTVLMPVYNGEKYLKEAVDSILDQSFKDYEFLIIDDGSTDGSGEIIKSYADPRIKVLENGENLGLVTTLNKGIELARGEFIARMDCDDVSLPERLEKQVRFMDSRLDVGVCGTWLRKIGSAHDVVSYPVEDKDIRWFLTINSMFAHPSVMLRHDLLTNHNLRYDANFPHAEDYELWTRIAKYCRLANLPEVLLLYRIHGEQIGAKYNIEQVATGGRVRMAQLCNLGISFGSKEFNLHEEIFAGVQKGIGKRGYAARISFLKDSETWLMKLLDANKHGALLNSASFDNILAERWFVICSQSSGLGLSAWNLFRNSALSKLVTLPALNKFKFWIRCMIKWKVT